MRTTNWARSAGIANIWSPRPFFLLLIGLLSTTPLRAGDGESRPAADLKQPGRTNDSTIQHNDQQTLIDLEIIQISSDYAKLADPKLEEEIKAAGEDYMQIAGNYGQAERIAQTRLFASWPEPAMFIGVHRNVSMGEDVPPDVKKKLARLLGDKHAEVFLEIKGQWLEQTKPSKTPLEVTLKQTVLNKDFAKRFQERMSMTTLHNVRTKIVDYIAGDTCVILGEVIASWDNNERPTRLVLRITARPFTSTTADHSQLDSTAADEPRSLAVFLLLTQKAEGGKPGHCAGVNRHGQIVFELKCHRPGYFEFQEELLAVNVGDKENPKFGYIDQTGKMVIEPRFTGAGDFKDGLASASIDGERGFINKKGEWAFKMRPSRSWGFSEDLGLVKVDGQWKYIDRTGKVVIETDLDDNDAKPTCLFHEGLAKTKVGDKWGFMDKTGKVVIEPRFDRTKHFQEGLAPVEIDGKQGCIDKTGQLVIPAKFDFVDNFYEGLARANLGGSRRSSGKGRLYGNWGFIDKQGQFVIEPTFSYVERFSDGLAHVQLGGMRVTDTIRGTRSGTTLAMTKDTRGGYINRAGQIVITPQFESAGLFRDGVAFVETGTNRDQGGRFINRSWGLINKSGELIFAFDISP